MNDEYSTAHTERYEPHRRNIWQMALAVGDLFVDWLEDSLRVIIREKELFLGSLLFLIGLLDFRSGKYCDGNTADYLSCTRPVTYYYYTWLEIVLIILGVMLILLWFMKRERR